MGTKVLRLAAVAALVVVAACGSGQDPGGVSSQNVPRPSTESTDSAVPGEEPAELTADAWRAEPGPRAMEADSTLQGVDYEPGQCVTWDSVSEGPTRTSAVDCLQPHRAQVAGNLGSPGPTVGSYPTEAEWDWFRRQECSPVVEQFLGRPVDPYGRLSVYLVFPTRESWEQGDRTTTCAVSASRDTLDGDPELMTGDARAVRDQAFDFPPGTCLSGNGWGPVACTEPHEAEVVTRLSYPELPDVPDAADEDALWVQCHTAIRSYLGADPVAPWGAGLETMQAESWAAGTRAVHCFVGHWDEAAQDWIEVTGPAPRG